MDTEKVIQDLNRRFAAPLPEFYRRRIIFWHDEDREFEDKLSEIRLDNAKLLKVTGSNFFAIKKLLSMDDQTGNYLVYCPVSYENLEDNWLLNIELYSGDPFRADLNTMWMDEMGLSTAQMLRNQVKRYHKFFNAKDRRAKVAALAGSINTAPQLHLAVMAVICGIKELNPNDIIRTVIQGGLDTDSNPVYQGLVNYGAQEAFWALVARRTGFTITDKPNIAELATHILMTALTRTMRRDFLAGLDSYISVPHQSYCYDFVSDWLRSGELHELYTVARHVEDALRLRLRFSKLDLAELMDTEFFPCINEIILSKLMTEIKDEIIQVDVIAGAVEKRRTMIWYDFMSSYYEGLLQVAKMQSFFLEHSAGFHTATAKDIWDEYTSDYYRMDACYRQFHLCLQRSLKKSNELLDDLFKAVADKVEALYTGWYLTGLGGNWTSICSEDLEKFGHVSSVSYQEDFYRKNIQLCDNRVFVIISDALRYEVAVTLSEQLQRETQSRVGLSSQCGIFPTITPYGMAALLPHKELSVEAKSNGGLAVLADGKPTDSLNREKVLKTTKANSVALQYKNIIGMKRAERTDLVKGMDVVYIYHDKIDEASHTSDSAVFPACDEAIDEIKNLVRIIVNEFGGTRIFITADHGFLYTYSPLTEDDKVSKSSWNGNDVEYGRRYAIMQKGAQPEYLQPVRFLGGKTDYVAFAPKENIRIKMSGGGMNFVHGGISLQELVVPVIDYHYLRTDTKEYQRNRDKIDTKPVTVNLYSASRKISNKIFSLNFYQTEAVGANREKAAYNLFFTDVAGQAVSDTVKIIADKTSNDPQERTFRCSFNLKSLQFDNKETYYLVIADESNLQLPTREEFQIDIPFATDEFGF